MSNPTNDPTPSSENGNPFSWLGNYKLYIATVLVPSITTILVVIIANEIKPSSEQCIVQARGNLKQNSEWSLFSDYEFKEGQVVHIGQVNGSWQIIETEEEATRAGNPEFSKSFDNFGLPSNLNIALRKHYKRPTGDGFLAPNLPLGALIGKIGEGKEEIFPINSTTSEHVVQHSGKLYFAMNDLSGQAVNNAGSLSMQVSYLHKYWAAVVPVIKPILCSLQFTQSAATANGLCK